MIGQTVSHYRIVAKLGEGGMGVVYRAEDLTLGRQVALKFLPSGLSNDPTSRRRFLQEAKAAASLDHGGICTVYEAGEADDRLFIAMALLEGKTLKQRIAEGPVPLPEALQIASQVATALHVAHSKGVIHRDIKPANIMLAPDGQAKLMDFGLARIAGTTQLTRSGSMVGTVAYMSPEQARGEEVDLRTDIWSLGVVLYEMVSSRLPFRSDHEQATIYAILYVEPDPVQCHRPDIPSRLGQVVTIALRKDPRERFQDMEGLLSELRSARDDLETANQSTRRSAEKAVPSIAVLPFVDMSPDKSQAYFGEGIAEELIHTLARIKDLRVVARTSAFSVAGKRLDVREVGRTLSVGAVLEGSVRQAGDRLRVTAQLIDAESGFHLWSDRFDRDAGDIFAIQDELSLAIVEHLKVSLQIGERAALQKRPTTDPEAYAFYLKGLYLFARPRPDLLDTALRFFRQALDLDPGFAKAWVGIGYVHAMLANLNFAVPSEAWPKAKAAIEKALLLDEQLPEAHALAATLSFSYERDWAAAAANFQRVLALNPSNAFTHGEYAWYLLTRRRYDESLQEIKLAITLDPLMPLFYGWSVGLHAAMGHCDAAIADFERSLEIDPSFGLSYFHAGIAYFRKQQLDKAVETLEAGRNIAIHPGWAEGMLVLIDVARGDVEGARRGVREMIEHKARANVASVSIGWALAAVGDVDGAIGWLERGIEEHDSLVNFLHIYTDLFAPALLHDARYQQLIARLNLVDVAAT